MNRQPFIEQLKLVCPRADKLSIIESSESQFIQSFIRPRTTFGISSVYQINSL
jgi:hypothetical protein